jgi:hypothetical protein
MKKILLFLIAFVCAVTTTYAQTNSFQLDFSKGSIGALPEGWTLNTFQDKLVPNFALKEDAMGRYLSLSGGGDSKANAYISTTVRLAPGTYQYKALFSISDDVNPQRNLLFQYNRGGIVKYYRLGNGLVEGRETFVVPGNQSRDADIKIYYRFNAGGEVKIRSLTIIPAEPVQPRWARFACTQDTVNYHNMAAIAFQAAQEKADLLLLPEGVSQMGRYQTDSDSLMALLSELAAKHRMYMAASIYVVDKTDGKKYNRGVLYDRSGKLCGIYDKIHPYSPEANVSGVTPGSRTDIFETDFGKVGMIICADSWFTDVTQLFALKGAEVILFPVAGYFRSIIHARSADNQVRFVISAVDRRFGYGIFDTAGRDIQNPDKDPTLFASSSAQSFKDIRTFEVDGVGLLVGSLDMNCNISPHDWGGNMVDAPGGKRNRDDQVIYLEEMIKKEKERWWENLNSE